MTDDVYRDHRLGRDGGARRDAEGGGAAHRRRSARGLRSAGRARRIAALGFTAVARGPEEFAAAYRKELPVWERLVKSTGATLD